MSARVAALLAAAPSYAALFLAGAARADVVVELRGGNAPVRASAATADLAGLTLRLVEPGKGERREVVPWDFVRAVGSGGGGADAPVGGDFLELGEDLWRARIRVERGDAPFARPLVRATGSACAARPDRRARSRPRSSSAARSRISISARRPSRGSSSSGTARRANRRDSPRLRR